MASKIIFLAALAAAWAPPSFLREPRRALQTCPETTAIEERNCDELPVPAGDLLSCSDECLCKGDYCLGDGACASDDLDNCADGADVYFVDKALGLTGGASCRPCPAKEDCPALRALEADECDQHGRVDDLRECAEDVDLRVGNVCKGTGECFTDAALDNCGGDDLYMVTAFGEGDSAGCPRLEVVPEDQCPDAEQIEALPSCHDSCNCDGALCVGGGSSRKNCGAGSVKQCGGRSVFRITSTFYTDRDGCDACSPCPNLKPVKESHCEKWGAPADLPLCDDPCLCVGGHCRGEGFCGSFTLDNCGFLDVFEVTSVHNVPGGAECAPCPAKEDCPALRPLKKDECDSVDEDKIRSKGCDEGQLVVGDVCEAGGECWTDKDLNNCGSDDLYEIVAFGDGCPYMEPVASDRCPADSLLEALPYCDANCPCDGSFCLGKSNGLGHCGASDDLKNCGDKSVYHITSVLYADRDDCAECYSPTPQPTMKPPTRSEGDCPVLGAINSDMCNLLEAPVDRLPRCTVDCLCTGMHCVGDGQCGTEDGLNNCPDGADVYEVLSALNVPRNENCPPCPAKPGCPALEPLGRCPEGDETVEFGSCKFEDGVAPVGALCEGGGECWTDDDLNACGSKDTYKVVANGANCPYLELVAEDECPKHSDAAALPFCTDSCPCAGELCKGKVEGGGADTCGAASDADNCREKTAQGAMLDVGVYRVTSTFYADRAGCDNKCWREPDPVKETPQPTRMPASVDYAPTYSPTNEDGSCMRPLSHGPPPDGWTSDDCDDYVHEDTCFDGTTWPSDEVYMNAPTKPGKCVHCGHGDKQCTNNAHDCLSCEDGYEIFVTFKDCSGFCVDAETMYYFNNIVNIEFTWDTEECKLWNCPGSSWWEDEDTDDGEQCTRPLSHGPPPDGWTSDDCDDYVHEETCFDGNSWPNDEVYRNAPSMPGKCVHCGHGDKQCTNNAHDCLSCEDGYEIFVTFKDCSGFCVDAETMYYFTDIVNIEFPWDTEQCKLWNCPGSSWWEDEGEDNDEDEQCTRPLSHGPPPDGWTSDDCDDYVHEETCFDGNSWPNDEVYRNAPSMPGKCVHCGHGDKQCTNNAHDCLSCEEGYEIFVTFKDCSGFCVDAETMYYFTDIVNIEFPWDTEACKLWNCPGSSWWEDDAKIIAEPGCYRLKELDASECPDSLGGLPEKCNVPGLGEGDYCEGDGECGTTNSLNNCAGGADVYQLIGNQPTPMPTTALAVRTGVRFKTNKLEQHVPGWEDDASLEDDVAAAVLATGIADVVYAVSFETMPDIESRRRLDYGSVAAVCDVGVNPLTLTAAERDDPAGVVAARVIQAATGPGPGGESLKKALKKENEDLELCYDAAATAAFAGADTFAEAAPSRKPSREPTRQPAVSPYPTRFSLDATNYPTPKPFFGIGDLTLEPTPYPSFGAPGSPKKSKKSSNTDGPIPGVGLAGGVAIIVFVVVLALLLCGMAYFLLFGGSSSPFSKKQRTPAAPFTSELELPTSDEPDRAGSRGLVAGDSYSKGLAAGRAIGSPAVNPVHDSAEFQDVHLAPN